jgi:hypothetical protein
VITLRVALVGGSPGLAAEAANPDWRAVLGCRGNIPVEALEAAPAS